MKKIALILGVAISAITFGCREPEEKPGLNPSVQEPVEDDGRYTREYGRHMDTSGSATAPKPGDDELEDPQDNNTN